MRPDGIEGSREVPFHSDACFHPNPVWGLYLFAQDISPGSPPTVFVSAVGACRRLPPDADPIRFPIATHPAILLDHPELGEVLYLNQLQTSHFEELEPHESEALLQEALAYI